MVIYSYYSWDSRGKNTEMVCCSHLQGTTFCHDAPPWSIHLGWTCMTWLTASLSYTRLWSMCSFWLAFCDCGFHSGDCGLIALAASVCALMYEDKRLMQVSWWERLAVGPPDTKSWLIGKDHYSEKGWGQEEKGMIEDEMVGWHHWLDGHEFEQALEDSEGQGSLICGSSWGHRESDMT